MKYKTINDEGKIKAALHLCYSFVPQLVKILLVRKGFMVKERGKGSNLVYEIQKGDSSVTAEFYFHNLYLEIATKDRDAELLEFDEGLIHFGYFLTKTLKMVESKLRPLFLVMREGNIGKGIEKMMELAPNYHRLRAIWRDKND